MYKIRTTKLFEKSVLKCKRQGKDIDKLKMVVDLLSTGAELSPRYRNHPLKGSVFGYTGCWECHIEPDWLLVYRRDRDELILELLRTGSHSELF